MNTERSGRPHRGNITLVTMVRNAKIKWFSAISIFNEILVKYGDKSMHNQINFSQQLNGRKRDKETTTKRQIERERNLLMKTET